MIKTSKEAGLKLRKLRGNIPSEKIASEIDGLSGSSLRQYELGLRNPKDEMKKKLANYYGTTVQAIFFDENCNEMTPQERS